MTGRNQANSVTEDNNAAGYSAIVFPCSTGRCLTERAVQSQKKQQKLQAIRSNIILWGFWQTKPPYSIRIKGKIVKQWLLQGCRATAENRAETGGKKAGASRKMSREKRGKMEEASQGRAEARRDLKWVMECGGWLQRGGARRRRKQEKEKWSRGLIEEKWMGELRKRRGRGEVVWAGAWIMQRGKAAIRHGPPPRPNF